MNKSLINANLISPVIGTTLIILLAYLFLLYNGLNEITRPFAPPGQSLYVLSKVIALLVYILMWWQIMLGIFNRVNTKYHIVLGTSLFILIASHAALFVTAVSIRQGELHLGILLPNFTIGYYKSGLSIGVIAFFLIFIATMASTLRSLLSKYWKYGHALVYLAFILATIHGLMIGSDINSGLFSYIVYGAVLSLITALVYKKLFLTKREM